MDIHFHCTDTFVAECKNHDGRSWLTLTVTERWGSIHEHVTTNDLTLFFRDDSKVAALAAAINGVVQPKRPDYALAACQRFLAEFDNTYDGEPMSQEMAETIGLMRLAVEPQTAVEVA